MEDPEVATESVRSVGVMAVCCIIIIIIATVAFFGNMSVVAIIYLNEELLESTPNLMTVNLAFTDMINAVLVMWPTVLAIAFDGWVLGKFYCGLQCAFNYGLQICSVQFILYINIDRIIAIRFPLHYNTIVTRPRVQVLCAWGWIFTAINAFPPMILDWVEYNPSEANCGINWTKYPRAILYAWPVYSICYIGPQVMLVITSIIIIRAAAKSDKKNIVKPSRIKSEEDGGGQSKQDESSGNSQMKLRLSVVVLVISLFIFMAPFGFTRCYKVTVGREDVFPEWTNIASSIFAHIASAVNPFLYAIFRKDFRLAFQRLFKSISNKIYPL